MTEGAIVAARFARCAAGTSIGSLLWGINAYEQRDRSNCSSR